MIKGAVFKVTLVLCFHSRSLCPSHTHTHMLCLVLFFVLSFLTLIRSLSLPLTLTLSSVLHFRRVHVSDKSTRELRGKKTTHNTIIERTCLSNRLNVCIYVVDSCVRLVFFYFNISGSLVLYRRAFVIILLSLHLNLKCFFLSGY